MKQKPILFSAPMVRAILDGNKTQTRRIVKPQPDEDGLAFLLHGGRWQDTSGVDYKCPYGQVGDVLWVRETWGIADRWLHSEITDPPRTIAYKADLSAKNFDPEYEVNTSDWGWENMKWKPSIHMWRWASRIQLEITGVRVERLNDISEADAKAEGLKAISKDGNLIKYGIPDADGLPGNDDLGLHWNEWEICPIQAYKKLWELINGAGSWDENPWVWCISFRVVK